MKKVLIIEDQLSFSSMLSTLLLDEHGFESVQVPSLAKAAKILEINFADFFVAIADLHLPDSNDGEIVDLVKSFDIPVLVFTGHFDEALREDMFYRGVADYTLKEGKHNVSHVIEMTNRIYQNYTTCVLVVDDSQSSRAIMKAMLRTQRFQVLEAKSAIEALILLKENDVNIVVTDCFMQDMDGFELTRRIRTSYMSDELAIVGISAHGSHTLSAKFMKYGADDFIQKPFEQEEFLSRIGHMATSLEMSKRLVELNEQKSRLLSVAAHEIREPLANINSIVKLVVDRIGTQEISRSIEMLKTVEFSSEELLLLLTDILCTSSIEEGRFNVNLSVDCLDPIVEIAVHDHRVSAERKKQTIEFHSNLSEKVSLDKQRIRQCLDNMLSNAIKYGPPNSIITVTCFEENDNQVCAISDEGKGISAESQDNLFMPFATLGSVPTGGETTMGLGLYICKTIVELHNGEMTYENENGESCFALKLPKHTPSLQTPHH